MRDERRVHLPLISTPNCLGLAVFVAKEYVTAIALPFVPNELQWVPFTSSPFYHSFAAFFVQFKQGAEIPSNRSLTEPSKTL